MALSSSVHAHVSFTAKSGFLCFEEYQEWLPPAAAPRPAMAIPGPWTWLLLSYLQIHSVFAQANLHSDMRQLDSSVGQKQTAFF